MLVESSIKQTVDLQGFRVVAVKWLSEGLEPQLAPDGRFSPRCGICGSLGRYRDRRAPRRFRRVPLWGIEVHLVHARRRVVCERYNGIHVEALGGGQGAVDARLDGDFGQLGTDIDLAAVHRCHQAARTRCDALFDKFHIVRHLMEAVDQVRRDEIWGKGADHKAWIAKTRYIWLKNPGI